jgi:hypothetical protein
MKLTFECSCGETTRWKPEHETEDNVHLRCENCESRYAVSFTRLVDGTAT